MGRLGPMRERLAFDPVKSENDGYGNVENGFDVTASIVRQGEVVYRRGGEAVEDGRRTGTGTYKVRIANSPATAAITTDWRMRNLRTGLSYDLIEVDSLSDRAWVWMVAEVRTGTDV